MTPPFANSAFHAARAIRCSGGTHTIHAFDAFPRRSPSHLSRWRQDGPKEELRFCSSKTAVSFECSATNCYKFMLREVPVPLGPQWRRGYHSCIPRLGDSRVGVPEGLHPSGGLFPMGQKKSADHVFLRGGGVISIWTRA